MKKSILIISVQGLGNTAMLVPVLKVLCEDPELDVSLVLSNNGSSALIEAMGLGIKKTYIWDETQKSFKNFLTLTRELRRKNFDTAYAAYLSGRREILLLSLLKATSKKSLKTRKGYFKLFKFLNKGERANESSHDIQNNLTLFDVNKAIITKNNCYKNLDEIIIGVHVGSKGVGKRWGILRYCSLMENLSKSFNVKFMIIAGKEEDGLISTIKEKTKLDTDVLLGVDFPTLINKLGSAHLVVGNDSSICHISAILGIPTVVIWAYADPIRVHPYGYGSIVIKMNYNCIPCYNIPSSYIDGCEYDFRCIKDIGEDKVLQILRIHIQELSAGNIPSTDNFKDLSILSHSDSFEDGCLILSLTTGG